MLNVVSKYLNINNYSDLIDNFRDLYLSHPNYPSLYAITDSFDSLRIENIAAYVPKDKFVELPQKFMTFFGNEFVLVSKHNDFVLIESDNLKEFQFKKDDFIVNWDGLFVGIEPNEKESKGLHYNKTFNYLKNGLFVFIPFLLLLFFKELDIYSLLITSVVVMGFLLSILIVNESFGINEKLVSNFCNFNSSVSCNKVFASSYSKINKWLSFIDLPIIFFGAGFLSIFFETGITNLIGFISLFAFPIIIYTIWIQKIKLKKWCPLCLLISFSLLSLGMFFIVYSSISSLTFQGLIVYILSTLPVSLLWFLIKDSLEKINKQSNEIYQLRKIKRNYSVFNFLTKPILNAEAFNSLKKINLGNSNAPIKICLLLSPSCFHCHKIFKDVITLIQNNSDSITVDIIFNINPNNKENPFNVVVETLTEMNITKSDKLFEAISDWHIHNFELEKWKNKWKINNVSSETVNLMHEYYDWCLLNNFSYTPVIIINQKLFPKEYELQDLNYFITDLIEENNH